MDILDKYKQLWNDWDDTLDIYKELWNIWDVRALILLSLFIQIVLIFLGRLRKTFTKKLIQLVVWSCYLLADGVASFIIGKLSNTMDDSASSSKAVLAFWAPFLLLHLGGPDTITAYSIEDNELWARHLLRFSYEVIIVVYVLFCSFPSKLLLAPTLLIFFVGIIKYIERLYSLYRASIEVFRGSIKDPFEQFANYFANQEKIKSSEYSLTKEKLVDLNEVFMVYNSCKPFFVDLIPSGQDYEMALHMVNNKTPEDLLSAMSMELSCAFDELYTKANINHSRDGYVLRVLCSVCIMLAFTLFVLVPKDGFDKLDVVITYVLLVASVCLDVKSAIMLLFSDWMVVSLLNVKKLGERELLLADYILRMRRYERKDWLGVIPQLNLMTSFLKNSAPKEAPRQRMMCWIIKKWSFVQEIKLSSQGRFSFPECTLCTLQPLRADKQLLITIATYAQRSILEQQKEARRKWLESFEEAETSMKESLEEAETSMKESSEKAKASMKESSEKAKASIKEYEEYEEMSKPAGLLALEMLTTKPDFAIESFSKLTKPLSFDEQVMVWHIATDLCYYSKLEYSFHRLHHCQIEGNTVDIKNLMDACKCLSNYMMHLVVMRPEMISFKKGVSSLKILYVYECMKRYFSTSCKHDVMTINAQVEALCKNMMTTTLFESCRSVSLFEIGRLLAHLMLFIKEEDRWNVVTFVWVELMIQVAMNTSGSMHLKQLSKEGDDLLTFIWLVNQHFRITDKNEFGEFYGDIVKISNHLISEINIK